MQKISLKLTVKTLGLLFIPAVFLFFAVNNTEAAVGLSVGNSSLNLGSTENLFYGNIGASSHASSSFLLLQKNNVNKFQIDSSGNLITTGSVTAGAIVGPLEGTLSAAHISNGVFGSQAGSGDYSFPGNLGIGASNPNALLHLYSSGNNIIRLTNSSTNYSNSGTIDFLEANATFGVNDYGFRFTFDGLDNKFYVQSAAGGASSTLITINRDGGNIGVGITNPAAKLAVTGGNIFIHDAAITAGTPKAAITKEYLDSAFDTIVGDNVGSGTSGQTLRHDGTSWVANSVLYNNGTNVGIGTSNPQTKNHIWSGEASAGVQEVSRLEGNWVSVGSGPLLRFTNQHDSGANPNAGEYNLAGIQGRDFSGNWAGGLVFMTPNSGTSGGSALVDRMVIRENGNVGIGTTNPGARLDLGGGSIDLPTNGAILFDNTNNNNQWYLGNRGASGATLVFGIGNTVYGNDKIVFDGSGNVGIGTTTPSSKLSISGGNIFINDAAITAGTPKAAITKEYLDSAFDTIVGDNVGSGTSGQTLRHDGTSWVANSVLYNNGTNVGIGTTNPGTKIDIFSNVTAGNNLKLQTVVTGSEPSATLDFYMQNISSGGSSAKIEAKQVDYQSNALIFSTESSNAMAERMRIHTNGNVGIGTTNPSSKLNVIAENDGDGIVIRRNAATDGVYADLRFSLTTSDTYNGATFIRTYRGPGGSGDNDMLFNVGGNNALMIKDSGSIGVGITNPTAKLDVTGGNIFINDAAITSGTPKAAITKEYLDSSLSAFNTESNLWRLNGSNVYASSTSWNVGIGTTNPGYKLDVAGTIKSNANIIAGTDITIGSGNRLIFGTTAVSILGSVSTNHLSFATNSGERMRIDSTGNVGIGTTAPSGKLAIQQNMSDYGTVFTSPHIKLLANNAVDNTGFVGITYAASTSDNYGWSSGAVRINNGQSNFIWKYHNASSSGTEYMRIDNIGNVGVGTTTPNAKLAVSGGNIFINDAAITSGTPKAAITKEYLDSSLSAFNTESNLWKLNGSNVYASSTSWNVGVGTTAPTQKLHVIGNIFANGNLFMNTQSMTSGIGWYNPNYYTWFDYMRNGGASNTPSGAAAPTDTASGVTSWARRFNTENSSSYGWIFESGSNSASAAATVKFAINAGTGTFHAVGKGLIDGSVGIGTTNPVNKLDVIGGNIFINDAAITSGTPKAAITKEYLDSAFDTIVGDNVGSGTSGQTLRHDGTSWVANSILYNNGTNIGVGKTNPIYKLDLSGVMNITGGYSEPSSETGYRLKFADNGGITNDSGIGLSGVLGNENLWINKGSANGSIRFMFGTIGEKVTFTSAGNVGIGITNPDMKLRVQGSAYVQDVLRMGNFRHVLSAGFTTTATNGYLLTTALPYNGTTNLGMHTIRIQGFAYGLNKPIDFVVNFYLYGSGFSTYGWTNYGAYDPGTVKLSYEGNILKLWWSNVLYYPSFEVFTTSWIGAVDNNAYFEGWTITDAVAPTTNVVNVPYKNAEPQGLTMKGNLSLNSNWLSGDGGNEGVFVDNTGNVGIGVSSLAARLSVTGGNIFINDAAITSGTPKAAITKEYLDSSLSAFNTESNLWKLNGSNVYASSTSWNVGIGTTNPLKRLQVAQDLTYSQSQSGQLYLSSADGVKRLMLGYDSTNNFGFIEGVNFGTSYSNVVINPVQGNVGIGTTAPSAKLEVNGTLKIGNSSLILGGINAVQTIDMVNGDIYNSGSQLMITATGANGLRLTDDNGGILNMDAGNVGISTTSPGAKLGVTGGNIFINDAAITSGTPKAAITKEYLDSAFDTIVGDNVGSGTSGQTLRHDGTSWVANSVLYNNGTNIGIGTVPGYKLDVNGSFRVSSTGNFETSADQILQLKQLGIAGTAGVKDPGWNYIGFLDSEGDRQGYFGIDSGGNMLFNPEVSGATVRTSSGLVVASGSLNISNGSLIQSGTANSSFSGSLGVGITSPNAKLDVSGGNIFINDAAITSGTPKAAITKEYLDSALGAAQTAFWNLNGSSLYASSTSWNVGIGTTNPLNKLVIASGDTAPSFNSTTVTNASLQISNSDSNYGTFFGSLGSGTGLIQQRRVNAATYYNLAIQPFGGNVGIGTSAPISLLTAFGANPRLSIVHNVLNAGDTGIDFILNPSMTVERKNAIIVKAAGSYGRGDMSFVLDSSLDSANYDITADTKMIIRNSGYVGIGTTNPAENLDVVGNIKSSGYGIFPSGIVPAATGAPDSKIFSPSGAYVSNTTWGINYNEGSPDYIEFNNTSSATAKIALDNGGAQFGLGGGSVTISTTTIISKLDVAGGNIFIHDSAITSGTPKAAVTKEYLDSSLSAFGSVPKFVGVTVSAYNGNSGGNPGYGYANSLCAAAFTGSHVCTTYEMLNTINASSTMPTVDVWVHSGPPGYTALANDCDGRRSTSSSAYGAYWQMSDSGYAPQGRGLLMTCNNSLQYACCK